MDGQKGEREARSRNWRPGPVIKTAALCLVLALLVLVGIRLYAWAQQAADARVVVLVNDWNEVDNSGFVPRLRETEDAFQVDQSCRAPLEKMLAECREAGFQPRIAAAWRSREEQQRLFDEELERQLPFARGDRALAADMAARWVGRPGCSEHELGLAVDLDCDDGQEEAMLQWFCENGWRFGFILRYPEGAEAVTGMHANAAHFRYVGLAAAGQIYTLDTTLEEYMGLFFSESAEIIFEK